MRFLLTPLLLLLIAVLCAQSSAKRHQVLQPMQRKVPFSDPSFLDVKLTPRTVEEHVRRNMAAHLAAQKQQFAEKFGVEMDQVIDRSEIQLSETPFAQNPLEFVEAESTAQATVHLNRTAMHEHINAGSPWFSPKDGHTEGHEFCMQVSIPLYEPAPTVSLNLFFALGFTTGPEVDFTFPSGGGKVKTRPVTLHGAIAGTVNIKFGLGKLSVTLDLFLQVRLEISCDNVQMVALGNTAGESAMKKVGTGVAAVAGFHTGPARLLYIWLARITAAKFMGSAAVEQATIKSLFQGYGYSKAEADLALEGLAKARLHLDPATGLLKPEFAGKNMLIGSWSIAAQIWNRRITQYITDCVDLATSFNKLKDFITAKPIKDDRGNFPDAKSKPDLALTAAKNAEIASRSGKPAQIDKAVTADLALQTFAMVLRYQLRDGPFYHFFRGEEGDTKTFFTRKTVPKEIKTGVWGAANNCANVSPLGQGEYIDPMTKKASANPKPSFPKLFCDLCKSLGPRGSGPTAVVIPATNPSSFKFKSGAEVAIMEAVQKLLPSVVTRAHLFAVEMKKTETDRDKILLLLGKYLAGYATPTSPQPTDSGAALKAKTQNDFDTAFYMHPNGETMSGQGWLRLANPQNYAEACVTAVQEAQANIDRALARLAYPEVIKYKLMIDIGLSAGWTGTWDMCTPDFNAIQVGVGWAKEGVMEPGETFISGAWTKTFKANFVLPVFVPGLATVDAIGQAKAFLSPDGGVPPGTIFAQFGIEWDKFERGSDMSIELSLWVLAPNSWTALGLAGVETIRTAVATIKDALDQVAAVGVDAATVSDEKPTAKGKTRGRKLKAVFKALWSQKFFDAMKKVFWVSGESVVSSTKTVADGGGAGVARFRVKFTRKGGKWNTPAEPNTANLDIVNTIKLPVGIVSFYYSHTVSFDLAEIWNALLSKAPAGETVTATGDSTIPIIDEARTDVCNYCNLAINNMEQGRSILDTCNGQGVNMKGEPVGERDRPGCQVVTSYIQYITEGEGWAVVGKASVKGFTNWMKANCVGDKCKDEYGQTDFQEVCRQMNLACFFHKNDVPPDSALLVSGR